MAKVTYYYNTESCNYEPVKVTRKDILLQIIGFLTISGILASGLIFLYQSNFKSIKETRLLEENQRLTLDWQILQEELDASYQVVKGLEFKDDEIYRVILDAEPIPVSVREGGVGGSDRYGDILKENVRQQDFIIKMYEEMESLKKKLYIQSKSYDHISELLTEKERMWASRPAIQPISNEELVRIASGFNPARFNPIAKRIMPHKGIDFTASKNTPIYATGDGRIGSAYRSSTYGNVIFLDHGYGYQTRYAHLEKFNVKVGDRVKRGQVIGYVGNTGRSVSDHLHYEVLFKGTHINPINFFQRDLSNEEYEKLIEISEQSHEVLD